MTARLSRWSVLEQGWHHSEAFSKSEWQRLKPERPDSGKRFCSLAVEVLTSDRLFADELDKWEKLGAVKVYYAFSKATNESEGCKYVQDRLWREREETSNLFSQGGRAYICGSAAVGKAVADKVAGMRMEGAERKGLSTTYEEALKWWDGLRGERYAVDVFD